MPRPSDLKDFRRHAEWALVSVTALELGVFDALSERPRTSEALAAALELDGRATRVLLGVLEEMELIRSEPDGRWRVTGPTRGLLLDRDTPDYQRDAVLRWLSQLRDWAAELPGALRRGGPPPGEDEEADDPEALERFQAAMANKNPTLVGEVVDACLDRAPERGRVLDVGGGPGTFSREFLARGWEAVLVDRPEVVEHVASAYGLERLAGLELAAGDFNESLPEGPFDAVLLANITHIYDPAINRRLLERCAGRLAPGGVLCVMDFVRGVEPFAALFAVTMLMNTESGGTYTLDRYRGWLEDAGLREVRCVTVSEERQVVTAVRPT